MRYFFCICPFCGGFCGKRKLRPQGRWCRSFAAGTFCESTGQGGVLDFPAKDAWQGGALFFSRKTHGREVLCFSREKHMAGRCFGFSRERRMVGRCFRAFRKSPRQGAFMPCYPNGAKYGSDNVISALPRQSSCSFSSSAASRPESSTKGIVTRPANSVSSCRAPASAKRR